jgi:hypothetical protein
MRASTERKIIRWFHILASIPILGYIYGPVADLPEAAVAVRWVILPLVVMSGFWLWLGAKVKRWVKGLGKEKVYSVARKG